MWKKFKNEVNNKKIICYGAGNNAITMLNCAQFDPYLDKIDFFVDKDKLKQGQEIEVKQKLFSVVGTECLEKPSEEKVILITLADYKNLEFELTQRGWVCFCWKQISIDIEFEKIEKELLPGKSERRFFLLNTPDYPNLGDHAIVLGERDFLHDFDEQVLEIGSSFCGSEGIERLSGYVKRKDVIFVQGGGNMGSLWRTCENNIRSIVSVFKNNPIIIFPQSIYYGDSEEEKEYFEKSLEIYNSHPNLLICARDKQSLEYMRKYYKCKTMLIPDMVLRINKINRNNNRNGIGLLLRDDKEHLINGDFGALLEKEILGRNKKIIKISHHSDYLKVTREKRFEEMMSVYSSCEMIFTDRLHGMVFSAISGTPCVFFDNSYGKLSSLYESWLSDLPYIKMGRADKSEISWYLERMIKKEQEISVYPNYEKYYEPLLNYLNEEVLNV